MMQKNYRIGLQLNTSSFGSLYRSSYFTEPRLQNTYVPFITKSSKCTYR
jgi:hypothetical protein